MRRLHKVSHQWEASIGFANRGDVSTAFLLLTSVRHEIWDLFAWRSPATEKSPYRHKVATALVHQSYVPTATIPHNSKGTHIKISIIGAMQRPTNAPCSSWSQRGRDPLM